MTKLPTFQEWLASHDETNERFNLRSGLLGAAVAGAGLLGGQQLLKKGTETPQPAAKQGNIWGSNLNKSMTVQDRDEKNGVWVFSASGYDQNSTSAQKEAERLVRDELMEPYANYEFGKGKMSRTISNAPNPILSSDVEQLPNGTLKITVRKMKRPNW